MDHSSKPEKTPFWKKLTGKGFYFALAVCIVAVGGVATAAFTGGFSGLDQSHKDPAVTTTTGDKAVNKPKTDVPDTRVSTTTTTTTGTTTTSNPDKEANAPVSPQLMVLPMGNQLVKEFSDGKAVYSETMADFRTHNGVDFAGKAGDKVGAVSGGKITAIKEDALWGKMIVIDHDHGITSTYCGVTAAGIAEGDTVKAGQSIGVLSDIPCELLSGPHLHLEIAVNGETVDPVDAIGLEVVPVTTTTTTTKATTTTTAKTTAVKTTASSVKTTTSTTKKSA